MATHNLHRAIAELAWVVGLLAPAAAAQQPANAHIEGLVIDRTSRSGVPRVEVQLDDTVRTTTDAEGRFRLLSVTREAHKIAFSLVGYEPKSYHLPIGESDRELFVSVALEPLVLGLIHTRSRVEGTVIDAISRRGVRGVRIQLDDTVSTVSDAQGMFELRGVIPGWRRIRLTRIGYLPRVLGLPVEWANQHVFVSVPLQPLAVELEPVVVRGDTAASIVRGRVAEFFRRQHQYAAFGRFLTRRELERQNPVRVSSVLLSFPGVRVDNEGRVTIREGAAGMNEPTGRRCPPALYLNGMFLSGVRIDDMARPEDLVAIEVYRSPITTPLELVRPGTCGAIVLWTP